jgi:hypothetical protein
MWWLFSFFFRVYWCLVGFLEFGVGVYAVDFGGSPLLLVVSVVVSQNITTSFFPSAS